MDDIFDRLTRAWSKQNVGEVLELFTPDCVYADMALGVEHVGHAGLTDFLEFVWTTMPDFEVEFHDTVIAGERGAARWVIRAHWSGLFEGVDCTGKFIEYTGLSAYEFRDGRIARNTDCWDFVSMIRAFDVLPHNLAELRVGMPAGLDA